MCTSHNLTVLSSDAEAANLVSLLNTAALTQLTCPTKEHQKRAPCEPHILHVLSSEPVIKYLPSPDQLTLRTGAL